ncbi:hypothetical protein EJ04DRAFT_499353 [Polyplosphaeria fusca]|uniref:Uncharacterized protein n=1 Tax=Polyplosphaeria fusca TaxID=682080 RepID=A0A9P4QUA9_9PLEO|nr:hypothetical protein EJ04DRAFT_499353 [Polyplosphaeria fusca]
MMVPFRNRRSREARRSVEEPNSFEWQSERERDQFIDMYPIHPLPTMQAPFEESMLDSSSENGFVPFSSPDKTVDVRQQLICKETDLSELEWNFTYNCHWRNNSKGNFHPLLKTITQIVFGVHLLHQHLERSVADVADILLKHVNELDSFLKRANEDIEGSLTDMLFRRKCLKVPMEHVNEFDRLLEDRLYRAQLLDGNITIERTINRMSGLLNDYLVDMSTFRDANEELNAYLQHIGTAWVDENDDVGLIYSAMCGNTAGWSQFLQSLVSKAERLGVVLVQVSSYCNEIEKRCGAASRRSLIASRSSSRNSANSRDTGRSFRNFAANKPLPNVPNERPPFMSSPASTDAAPSDATAPQRHPSVRRASKSASPLAPVAGSVTEGSPEQRQNSADPMGSTPLDLFAPPASSPHADSEGKATLHQDPFVSSEDSREHGENDTHGVAAFHEEHRLAEHHSQSGSDSNDTIVPKRIILRDAMGEQSPPLTGKDSAYSSVSGGSFASPTLMHHPRSASASSHPRAQFALFPSSGPSTPKHSMSGRYSVMSPALASPQLEEYPIRLPQRASTSLDNHAPASRRLLKKSSLSSLKRLFSKKKHGSVDTIAE